MCVHSTFAYRDVRDPLKMYRGKYCGEKFLEHIETLLQLPMTELTDVLKREHEAAEKLVPKSLMTLIIER